MYRYWELETTELSAVDDIPFSRPGYNLMSERDIAVYNIRKQFNTSWNEPWWDGESLW